jgi:hypothetical protein
MLRMRALATSGHQLHAAVQHVLKMPGTKKRVKEINAFFRKIRKQKRTDPTASHSSS